MKTAATVGQLFVEPPARSKGNRPNARLVSELTNMRITMNELLLVVDMQNVYRENAPWECRNMGETVRKIRFLLDSGRPDKVIFTRFDAPRRPHGTWRDYNEAYAGINEDEYGNEIMSDFISYLKEYPVYSKSTYSSYTIREVREAAAAADRVLLTGVVAECCILATLLSLIDAGTKVLYVRDAIAGQTPEWEETVAAMAASFSTIHTEVITTDDYLSGRTDCYMHPERHDESH